MADFSSQKPGFANETTTEPTTRPDPSDIIATYLKERVHEFRVLAAVRKDGWNDPSLDRVFEQQCQSADKANRKARQKMYSMMIRNGEELNSATGGFKIPRIDTDDNPITIVDFCMAPGAFLQIGLQANPGARALAFTLPSEKGGQEILLPGDKAVKVKFMDINLLADDMGM